MQKFSQRLISLRKERDLTQNDLARIIKKQRTTVSGYETMDKEPDFEVLCALAEYFGVTTDYLLGRDDERAHADVVFRNDNANFKRQYDRLPPELKAIITSTFDSFYVMLSRAMSAQRTDELALYRDLIEVLQLYPSANAAGRENGLSDSSIIKCCKGKLKTCGGYSWRYARI